MSCAGLALKRICFGQHMLPGRGQSCGEAGLLMRVACSRIDQIDPSSPLIC